MKTTPTVLFFCCNLLLLQYTNAIMELDPPPCTFKVANAPFCFCRQPSPQSTQREVPGLGVLSVESGIPHPIPPRGHVGPIGPQGLKDNLDNLEYGDTMDRNWAEGKQR